MCVKKEEIMKNRLCIILFGIWACISMLMLAVAISIDTTELTNEMTLLLPALAFGTQCYGALLGLFGVWKANNDRFKRGVFLGAFGLALMLIAPALNRNAHNAILFWSAIGISVAVVLVISIIEANHSSKAMVQRQQELAEQKKLSEEKEKKYDQEYNDSILRTVIVDSSHIATTRANTGSAVGRAMVGGALFGPAGAVVGAGTAKRKVRESHKTTFLVYFKDGTQRGIEVENGSKQYKMFMSKLSQ